MVIKRKSMYGLETEMFIIDDEGKLVNSAPEIIKATKGTSIERYVTKELSKCMIEMGAQEKRTIKESALAYIKNLKKLMNITEKLGYSLLPLGCHPGDSIKPELNENVWYDAKREVLGDKVVKEGLISGYHFHYMLPEGILGEQSQRIKTLGRSHAREIFIRHYNFIAACDPVMLTFCQSTPIWEGINWGKDCRVLVYRDLETARGSEKFRGIHYLLPIFGSLPTYQFTLEDIRVVAERRKTEWLRILEKNNYPTNEVACYPALKFMWGPLRVNKIGTVEYRGPDMNCPSVIFSTSRLLYHALKAIEKNQIRVVPSDIGIDEPFVLEDDKVYVPPHSTLKYLEHQSAINGFESEYLHNYCNSMFNFVDKLTKKGKEMKLLKKMLENKKSTSDEILSMIKKNGYSGGEKIPNGMLNHMALYYSNKLKEDVENIDKII